MLAKNRKQMKILLCCDEFQGRKLIEWHRQHKFMDQTCLMWTVQTGAVVCGMFFFDTRPLIPIHQCSMLQIIKSCCWRCTFLHSHYLSSNSYFQRDTATCHKAKVILNWFHEHDNEFSDLLSHPIWIQKMLWKSICPLCGAVVCFLVVVVFLHIFHTSMIWDHQTTFNITQTYSNMSKHKM